MQLLIDSGADLNAVRGNGHTALAAAVQQGHRACARWLIRSGASVNTARFDGYTPLHTAARKGDREMVQWLLGAGADHGLVAKVGRWASVIKSPTTWAQVWDKCGASVGPAIAQLKSNQRLRRAALCDAHACLPIRVGLTNRVQWTASTLSRSSLTRAPATVAHNH